MDTYGIPVKAVTRTYRRNVGDYRKGARCTRFGDSVSL